MMTLDARLARSGFERRVRERGARPSAPTSPRDPLAMVAMLGHAARSVHKIVACRDISRSRRAAPSRPRAAALTPGRRARRRSSRSRRPGA